MNKDDALLKISDILRMELAPSLPYDRREQVYAMADTIDSIIVEIKLSDRTENKEAISAAFTDSRTIYDVLGVH